MEVILQEDLKKEGPKPSSPGLALACICRKGKRNFRIGEGNIKAIKGRGIFRVDVTEPKIPGSEIGTAKQIQIERIEN